MNIKRINKNFFLLSFFLLALRSVIVELFSVSFSQALTVGVLILCFSVAARRNTIVTLFTFFALIPLLHGLRMLEIIPNLPVVDLCFAGIYIAWLPKYYLHSINNVDRPTTIEQLVDWLALIIIISLLTTLLQYPADVSWNVFSHRALLGQQDRFWGIEAAKIFMQGLAFFRIYTLEYRRTETNLKKYFFYALLFQVIIIFIFATLQGCFGLPTNWRFRSSHGAVHSPFDDIHSFGSILIMYLFILGGFLPSLRKGIFWITITALTGIILLIYNIASTATIVTLVFCLMVSACFFVNRKIIFICTILITGALIYYNTHPSLLNKIENHKIHRVARRLLLTDPYKGSVTARLEFADRALGIIATYPVSGSGIGSFWRISGYHHFFSPRPHSIKIENAHNYYLQLAANAGIPALLFFLAIFYLVFSSGINKNREPDILPNEISLQRGLLIGIGGYLITMLSNHPLLLPVQQFCLWMVIAQTVNFNSVPTTSSNISDRRSYNLFLSVILIIVILYGSYYRLKKFPSSPDYGYGGYLFENWGGEKVRWIGKNFATKKLATSDILSLTVNVVSHNIDEKKGLNLQLSIGDIEIDQRCFFHAGQYPLIYHIPGIKGKEITIKTALNKTFKPSKSGSSTDRRDLGIALETIRFLQITPPEDFGFHNWETTSAPPFPEFKNKSIIRGRWTKRRASIILRNLNEKYLQLYYKCTHPDINQHPATITIYADDQQVSQEICKNDDWQTIKLGSTVLNKHKLLTITIDRTWNPKSSGISEDTRNLGLFLTILPEKVYDEKDSN